MSSHLLFARGHVSLCVLFSMRCRQGKYMLEFKTRYVLFLLSPSILFFIFLHILSSLQCALGVVHSIVHSIVHSTAVWIYLHCSVRRELRLQFQVLVVLVKGGRVSAAASPCSRTVHVGWLTVTHTSQWALSSHVSVYTLLT